MGAQRLGAWRRRGLEDQMIGAGIGNRAGFVEAARTGQGAEDVAEGSAQGRTQVGGEIEALARYESNPVQRERKSGAVRKIGRGGNPPCSGAAGGRIIVAAMGAELKLCRIGFA